MPMIGGGDVQETFAKYDYFPRATRLLLVNYFRTQAGMSHDEALKKVDEIEKYMRLNS